MSEKNNNQTIFIVEDNIVNMKLIQDILMFNQYNIVQAYSGTEAVEKMEQHWQEIDLILMDIQLPEIDGLELIKRFKKDDRFKNVPIIVLSAHAMENDMLKAKEAGANSYITKPINVEKFMQEIKSVFTESKVK